MPDNGGIERIDLSGGREHVTDVVLDPDRNITQAVIHLADGSSKTFSDGQILEEIEADGTRTYYDKGRIVKIVKCDVSGTATTTFLYAYETNMSGQVTGIRVTTGGITNKYDPYSGAIPGLSNLTLGRMNFSRSFTGGQSADYLWGNIVKLYQNGIASKTYEYEYGQDGAPVSVWAKEAGGSRRIKYDMSGNLLGVELSNIFNTAVFQNNATHRYTYSNGPRSVDGDLATYQSFDYSAPAGSGVYGGGDVVSEHLFVSPVSVSQIKYAAEAYYQSDCWTNNSSDASLILEIKDAVTGQWIRVPAASIIPGESAGGSGPHSRTASTNGLMTFAVNLDNVAGIRLTGHLWGYTNNNGGPKSGHAYIYELGYTVKDQPTYFAYTSIKNAATGLTDYRFIRGIEQFVFDDSGALKSGSPVYLAAAINPLKNVFDNLTFNPEQALITASYDSRADEWTAATRSAIVEADALVTQEYSVDGSMQTQTKADRTVTTYENNKPAMLYDEEGRLLIEYSYNAQGNPTRVYLKNARDTLPDEIAAARRKIEEARADSLETLAAQKNLAYASIKTQADTQAQALQNQLQSLQDQYNSVAGIEVSGKKAKNQRGDVLNQIGHTMDQVRGALTTLAQQEADAYAGLDAQVKALSDQISADAASAFGDLAAQENNLKKEILRQEVSPIVYDYYRRILGRDPGSAEYDYWIGRIDFNSPDGKCADGNTLVSVLTTHLNALPELFQR
ncbi:MAG: hypothetical protein WCG06_04515, partial [Candidatus Omnitrophota bacterium]